MARRIAHSARIAAEPEDLFALLDDHARAGRDMTKPSGMMFGGAMAYEVDAKGGRATGSRIRVSGRVLGLALEVKEIVTARAPPRLKAWKTVGQPRLIVLRTYRIEFQIAAAPGGSDLWVAIDYDPTPGLGLLARAYARWCVERIVDDAVRAFGVTTETKRYDSATRTPSPGSLD